jgi:hypothetical protein
MHRSLLALAAASLLVVSCRGGSTKAPTPVVVPDVQQQAVRAAATLTGAVVHVTGHAAQNSTSVDFTIEYRQAADRFAYTATSTFQGQTADIQVIGVPPQAWSLEAGAWKPLAGALTVDTFRAARMWSLVPFSQAALDGTESVGGVQANHYHAEAGVHLAFGELAGSLIASGDAEFTGALSHATIDYWVDKEHGWPVKAVYHASGDGDLDLTAELVQANDPAIAIDPPK